MGMDNIKMKQEAVIARHVLVEQNLKQIEVVVLIALKGNIAMHQHRLCVLIVQQGVILHQQYLNNVNYVELELIREQ
jgi:hypothetical protein